jgi:hypothetical protein
MDLRMMAISWTGFIFSDAKDLASKNPIPQEACLAMYWMQQL